ncbi:MAG: M24 family metallopeptidase [Myxococcales bacterium]|nr:M24 family metallopeptidase [Myxococcales bacterium]USN49957.1 MAG: M24 family metallopeptidase [Myxococcales bacterium]
MAESSSLSLSHIRNELKKRELSGVLIRSTDRYFNEYIPKNESPRALITGFDGSVGDAIITLEGAYLFVDGRYNLQAKSQASDYSVHVCSHNQSIENNWLSALNKIILPGQALAFDPATIDLKLFKKLRDISNDSGFSLSSAGRSIIEGVLVNVEPKAWEINAISQDITGLGTEEKIDRIHLALDAMNLNALLIVKLDDIAWLLNIRSNRYPFQSSVPGIAAVVNKKIILGLPEGLKTLDITLPKCELVKESEFFQRLKSELTKDSVIAIDERETSQAHEGGLREKEISFRSVMNPIMDLKAVKNERELAHMREAFYKADQVVDQTHRYVVECFEKEQAICESDVDAYVQKSFFASKATELSFRPICASGKNGAIIHYGTPDSKNYIERGSLFLLDCGAYYQGGYATDLTRTFLAASQNESAKDWQREMFTLVLMASIRGLSARIRRGTLGMQLDAIVRQPLWQQGLDFAHGTGHGVGINVHEFPPRVAPSSTSVLEPGHVFSIEPGLYFEDLGGVRIENLATIVPDPEDERFVRVLPLTFCPFDERLIEEKMLSTSDKAFLYYYRAQWQAGAQWPKLPPLSSVEWA